MKRKAKAVWHGSGTEGKGTLTTGSGAFDEQPYSTRMRFESEDGRLGTNPEELIAAAHAGCFTMAFSFQLSGAGHPPQELTTDALLDMQQDNGGWSIKSIHLDVRGRVEGISADQFQELARNAKEGCPVSRVLNADITMSAELL
jgi:lipoyl-dependent peroxiredoxin